MRRTPWGAAAVFSPLALLLAAAAFPQSASDSPGKPIFERRCGGCHALDRSIAGPRLGGVFGRQSGTVESFPYSEALKNAGISWDEASLDRWLSNPQKLVPGTDMEFQVESAAERRAIIAFLKESR